MKNIGVFFIVLLCAVSMVFTGCEDKNKGKTVVKIGNYPLDTDADSRKMWDKWIDQHHEKYPDVRIIPSRYDYSVDTFVPMAQGGGLPTLFVTYFTEPDKLIRSGLLRDITKEIEAIGWDEKISGFSRDLLVRDGKIYGVPSEAYALGLHLNMDLFRRAGLVDSEGFPLYPKTWEELAITARTIRERTGRAGLCLLAKDNAGGWHFTNIAWGFGAEFAVERDGKWIAQVNTPEVATALQYVKDLKWVYNALTPDPTNEDWGTGFAALGSGMAAMYIAGPGGSGTILINEQYGLPPGDLAVVPLPAGPGGQYSLGGGTIFAFPTYATSAEVTAALQFLETIGKAPVVTPDTVAAMNTSAHNLYNRGVAVLLDGISVWDDPEYNKARDDAIAEYLNVDMRFFNDYYQTVTKPGNIRNEDGGPLTQDLYAELTKALQAVLTDRNANVQALLDIAQRNFQSMLDRLN